MIRKATPDAPAYNQHGALLIKTSINPQGVISLYVTTGTTRIEKLSKAFTDRNQAAAFYRHIAQAAEAGKAIYQIEWEIEALIAAGVATDVEQIAEAINADGADYRAAETAEHNALVAAKDEIMADADPTWKTKVRTEAVQAGKHANQPDRYAVPTRTHVHTKPLTAAELDLIRNHTDGTVRTRPGQPWTMLQAIWRRIGGTPTYKPGTRIMTSLTLNARGLAVADEQRSAA